FVVVLQARGEHRGQNRLGGHVAMPGEVVGRPAVVKEADDLAEVENDGLNHARPTVISLVPKFLFGNVSPGKLRFGSGGSVRNRVSPTGVPKQEFGNEELG